MRQDVIEQSAALGPVPSATQAIDLKGTPTLSHYLDSNAVLEPKYCGSYILQVVTIHTIATKAFQRFSHRWFRIVKLHDDFHVEGKKPLNSLCLLLQSVFIGPY